MVKIIIVGTGRCGTGYLSKVFTESGFNTGHEKIFGLDTPDGMNSNKIERKRKLYSGVTVESSWLASPYIGDYGVVGKDIDLIYLVRNPYKVIHSFYNLKFFDKRDRKTPYTDFAVKHMTEMGFIQDGSIENYIDHFIFWNSMIEDKLELSDNRSKFFRVEDITSNPRELEVFVGRRLKKIENTQVNSIKKGKSKRIEYNDIVEMIQSSPRFGNLKEYSKKLGYGL